MQMTSNSNKGYFRGQKTLRKRKLNISSYHYGREAFCALQSMFGGLISGAEGGDFGQN